MGETCIEDGWLVLRRVHADAWDTVDDLKITIFQPSPVEAPPLPDRKALVCLVDALVPAAPLRKLDDAALHALALLLLRVWRRRAVGRTKGGCLVETIAADDTANLLGSVRDVIDETLGCAALDEAGDLLLQPVV